MTVKGDAYREYQPCLEGRSFIDCYWSYSADSAAGIRLGTHPVIPDGCVDIIFDLTLPVQAECLVVGAMTKPIQSSKTHLFGVRFKPGKAASFFKFPLQDATDQIFPIGDCCQIKTGHIAEQLAAERCNLQRARIVDAAFERSLSGISLPAQQIQYAVSAIESANGCMNIQSITDKIGWSRQHFSRVFLKHTGLTPKFFSQVIRVNRVIKAHKDAGNDSRLVDLAQTAGYYDQAHMANEFKKITGWSPQHFLKNA